MSPKTEGWLQIALNDLGKADAVNAAQFIRDYDGQKPGWGVSSDLKRAEQTLDICAKILDLKKVNPMPELRAFNHLKETDKEYEKRNMRAFTGILRTATQMKSVPVICCHRSNTAFLGKYLGGVKQDLDYRLHSLVHEGGVLVITDQSIRALFKFIGENAKEDISQPYDGTQSSGFVTAADNPPPRECEYCRWLDRDHCEHPMVTADDGIGVMYGYKRNENGKWIVNQNDCCDNFQSVKSLKVV
jgi:broad specificity phosphatase PhoE